MRTSKIWGIFLCVLFTTICYIPVNASTNINWTPAGKLAQGDILKTSDGKIIRVVSIKKKLSTHSMYNLTINKNHNFFIGGQDNTILVHNECTSASHIKNITINSENMRTSGIKTLKHISMDKSTALNKEDGIDGIVTTGMFDCATVAVCSNDMILMTHLRGSNFEYVDEDFTKMLGMLPQHIKNDARAIIYSPSFGRATDFDILREGSLENEHFLVENIGENLEKYGINSSRIKGYYNRGGSNGFGIGFLPDNQGLFYGEVDFDDNIRAIRASSPEYWNL